MDLQQVTPYRVIADHTLSRLPDEYQEVEWIKSHGTEYIELDIYQEQQMSLEMNFKYFNSDDWLFLATGQNDNAGTIPQLYIQRNRIIFGMTADVYNNYVDFANNIYPTNTDIEVNLSVTPSLATLSGTRSGTFTPSNDVSTHKIIVFGRYAEQGRPANLSSMQLDKLKITTSTTGNSCDLVPCYRKSDNVIGLYDIVNDYFYTNQGSGTFEKGADVGLKVLQKIMPCRVIISGSRLPVGYTEVEWVGAPDKYVVNNRISPYLIKTDIIPKTNIGIKFTVKELDYYVNDFNFIGSREATGDTRFMVNANGSSKDDFWISYGYGGFGGYKMYKINTTDEYEISLNFNNDRKFIVDSNQFNITTNFISNNSVFSIFGQNSEAGGSTNTIYSYKYKIKGDFIFTEGTTEIRRYVPCIRNSDEVAGFYELHTNTFVKNYDTSQALLIYGQPTGIKVLQPITMSRIKEV